jgi:Glycosyl transferase 4-like domain
VQQKDILYVSVDGVLQPLGYSQVCRVLLGLSKRGFRYRLFSLEKPADLADERRVRALTDELLASGIEWTHQPYVQGGTYRTAAANLARLGKGIHALLATGAIGLVHARAYKAALIARTAKRALGIPYIFDARGRWIDERLLARRWFTNPVIERGARRLERQLYRHASGLVTLTQLHADDIAAGDFGPPSGAPSRVITTCADFSCFTLEARQHSREQRSAIGDEVWHRLSGKLVVAFVGSTNAFYRHEESFQLAKEILDRRADAHLLIISAQKHEFAQLAARAQLPSDRVTIVTAPHSAMPQWLSRIDWAIQLLNSGVAKRGSMPTKLAEFFASGVQPLHFGCNSEVTDWVRRSGSGLILESLSREQLAAAADFVATVPPDLARLQNARSIARPHFDLASGLDAYASLLTELGHGSFAGAPRIAS